MFLCIALNTAARRVRRKSEQFRKKSFGYRHFGNPETQGTAVERWATRQKPAPVLILGGVDDRTGAAGASPMGPGPTERDPGKCDCRFRAKVGVRVQCVRGE